MSKPFHIQTVGMHTKNKKSVSDYNSYLLDNILYTKEK